MNDSMRRSSSQLLWAALMAGCASGHVHELALFSQSEKLVIVYDRGGIVNSESFRTDGRLCMVMPASTGVRAVCRESDTNLFEAVFDEIGQVHSLDCVAEMGNDIVSVEYHGVAKSTLPRAGSASCGEKFLAAVETAFNEAFPNYRGLGQPAH